VDGLVEGLDENVTPLLIVSGRAAAELEINASFGALGPGWRANATIGRALRLAMNNIGGGRFRTVRKSGSQILFGGSSDWFPRRGFESGRGQH